MIDVARMRVQDKVEMELRQTITKLEEAAEFETSQQVISEPEIIRLQPVILNDNSD